MEELFKFDVPGESTGFLLWKTNNLWQREIKRTLKKYDLTHTQFVILSSTYWLSMKRENITQVEIANFINIDKMMTSNVIRKLIEKKLLDRKEHKIDTRAKVVRLTDKGIRVLKNSLQEVEAFDTIFFEHLQNRNDFNNELIRLLESNSG